MDTIEEKSGNAISGKSIEQLASERVEQAQEKKSFKDTSVVKYTRKYKAALEIVTSKDLTEIEKDKVSAYKLIEKSKVWVKYDIEQLKSQGYSSGYCFFITKLRESLTNKPYDDERARKMYVIMVETIQPIIKDNRELFDLKEALYKFYNTIGVQITAELKDLDKTPSWAVSYYEGDHVKEKLVEMVVGKSFINMLKLKSDSAKNNFIAANLYNEFTQEQRQKAVDLKRQEIDKWKQKFLNDVANYKQKISTITDEKEKEKLFYQIFGFSAEYMNIDVFEQNRLDIIAKRYTNAESSLNEIYKVREERWDWYYKTDEKKEGKPKDEPRFKSILEEYGFDVGHKAVPLSHIKRTNSLKLPEIAVNSLVDLFGFKDVVYGNYVRDKESEAHTRYFISAILDMADILNMDIKQLNKAGDLSIFFGALGCGMFSKAFACYYPDRKAINLTKKNGDGTVSHEWGHFFDNICAEGSDRKAISDYATEGKIYLDIPEIKKCFKDIINFWDVGETKIVMKKFYGIENETSTFSLYGNDLDTAIEKLYKLRPNYKNYYSVVGDRQMYEYYSYLALKFGKLEPNELSVKGNKVYSLQVPLEIHSSYFKYISTEYDILNNKHYFAERVEMFARCFEAYIYTKMKQRNIENNYLCEYLHHYVNQFTGLPLSPQWIPYPYDKELEKIVELYDNLMKEVKKQFFIGEFHWETKERESQYVELTPDPVLDKKEKSITIDESGKVETDEQPLESDEVIIEHPTEKTDSLIDRIELLQEMIADETDSLKKEMYQDRIDLLKEMMEADQSEQSEQKSATENKIEQQKQEIIQETKKALEKPESVAQKTAEEAAEDDKPIHSNFQITNVENNPQAEKTSVFDKEVNYDTRKVLNRNADVKVGQDVIDKIEKEGVTIEFLDSLNTIIYKYKTQVTLHGDFSGVERERFGGYKVLTLNQNNTLGVKYVGIDIDKKKDIERCIYLAKSDWAFYMSSQGTQIRQMYAITKDNLEEIKQKCIKIFNSIPDVFIGNKYFNIINIPMYGTFAVINIYFNAIYQKDLYTFISFITDGKINSEQEKNALIAQEEAKDAADRLKSQEEYRIRAEKEIEYAKPLIEKLKNSCPYPVMTELSTYKKYIIAKIYKDGYMTETENKIKIKIAVYYIDKNLYFKRVVNDWNDISLSFERTIYEKRQKLDSLMPDIKKNIEKGLLRLVWFEPLPVKEERTHKPRYEKEIGKKYEKPEMKDVVGTTEQYEIIKSKHTKTGNDIWILKLKSTLDRDEYKAFEAKMKASGGYYSSFVKGFVFKNEPKFD